MLNINFKNNAEIFLSISYAPRPSGYGGSTGIDLSLENMESEEFTDLCDVVWKAVNDWCGEHPNVRWSDDTAV